MSYMYVYLDQSDLSRLGSLGTGDPTRKDIISLFNKNSLTLVLSWGHVTESAPISSQDLVKRATFIDEIKNKKVIKQFVEIVKEEISYLGTTPSPYYNNFYEAAGIVLSLSDPFGYLTTCMGAKKHIPNDKDSGKRYMQTREKTLEFQQRKRYSRKKIYERYFVYAKSKDFLDFIPKERGEKERKIIHSKIINRELIIPTYETDLQVRTQMTLDTKRPPDASDLEDILSHLPSLVYSAYFTTDRYFADIIKKASKYKGSISWGDCHYFGSAKDILRTLKEKVENNK